VREIFVDPKAAIPNERRDGFEENPAWHSMRDELDVAVAIRYGKLANKTSKADQLSVESLTNRLADLKAAALPLVNSGSADWDRVSQRVTEANNLQRKISNAVRVADENELAPRGRCQCQAGAQRIGRSISADERMSGRHRPGALGFDPAAV
jgi:hypothetical protein